MKQRVGVRHHSCRQEEQMVTVIIRELIKGLPREGEKLKDIFTINVITSVSLRSRCNWNIKKIMTRNTVAASKRREVPWH